MSVDRSIKYDESNKIVFANLKILINNVSACIKRLYTELWLICIEISMLVIDLEWIILRYTIESNYIDHVTSSIFVIIIVNDKYNLCTTSRPFTKMKIKGNMVDIGK